MSVYFSSHWIFLNQYDPLVLPETTKFHAHLHWLPGIDKVVAIKGASLATNNEQNEQ